MISALDKYRRFYVAGFFDLLGVTNELEKLSGVPDGPDESDDYERTLQSVAYAIEDFQRSLRTHFDQARSSHLGTQSTPEFLAFLADLKEPQLTFQTYSDLILVSARMMTDRGRISAATVVPLIGSVSMTMINTLCVSQVAFRGGIDIGFGTTVNSNFYGHPLLSCYELESKRAHWPRVLVGDGLRSFLEDPLVASTDEPALNQVNQALIEQAREMVAIDDDGEMIVDYLATYFVELHDEIGFRSMLDAAHLRVEALQNQFAADPHVGPKYNRQMSYFNSRLGELTSARRASGEEALSTRS